MKTSKVTFLAAAAVATMGFMGFATPAANASSVVSRLVLDGSTFNKLHDASAEYLVDNDGNGIISAGDQVRGMVSFGTINNSNAPTYLTGVFDLNVEAVENPATVGGQSVGDIIFGADDAGFNTWLGTLGAIGNANTGTIVRLWENPNNDISFTGSTTVDTNVATAAQGTFFQDWGFSNESQASHWNGSSIVSDNGEGWVALQGGLNINGATAVSPTATIGIGDFALNILKDGGQLAGANVLLHDDANVQPVINDVNSVGAQITGTSKLQGTNGTLYPAAGFPVTDSTDVYLVAVPVPATAFLGLALFGLIGVAGAWRKFRLAA